MSQAPAVPPLPPDVQALENEAREHPDAAWRHARLLGAFCASELQQHPRRIGLILDFISRFPRSLEAKCPFVHLDPVESPGAFRSIEALWSRLPAEHPGDPSLAIGHAALVANEDRFRAAEILKGVLAVLPEDAALWTELGRIAPEPSERFDALQRARELGSKQPNLLVWLGRAAVDAGRFEGVHEIGCELMSRASQARATVQPPIAWDDTARGAWARIRAALENSAERSQVIGVLMQYANDTHWAHTFLGLVRAEQGQLREAGSHLLRSAKVWGEPRLSSYGPSFMLARKLCQSGMWHDVEQFLVACKDIWDDQILNDWIQEVRSERVPEFDE